MKKTFSHGVQAQGSFTHGKCFDTGTTGTATDPFQNTLVNPMFFSREARYGPCDYDVRNLFVGNFYGSFLSQRSVEALGKPF